MKAEVLALMFCLSAPLIPIDYNYSFCISVAFSLILKYRNNETKIGLNSQRTVLRNPHINILDIDELLLSLNYFLYVNVILGIPLG